MTDMIEKVAKAIFEDTFKNVKWEDTDDVERRESMSNARAAIEALRDMSLEMNDAFRGQVMHKEYLGDADVHMGWNAAVDAALGEQENER